MSVWRRKAIECLPQLKKEFEHPDNSIYNVFSEMLSALVIAYKEQDNEKINRIYSFAEWCLNQKEKDLWNAAGVAFYEHLGDHQETLTELPKWVKPNIYAQIRGLLELRLEKADMKKIDKLYGLNKT
jgi:hypothetical protein